MKKIVAIVLALTLTVVLFGCSHAPEIEETTTTTTTTTTTQPDIATSNPFTGDAKFSSAAVGRRPVAIVVENTPSARPQWGIDTPDMIIEGEVEGGISRMLWMYADYSSVPSKVGPIRSARPSFVEFSELFDAIYVHWGGSHNKAGYVGGYGVFGRDNVAHIDGMAGGPLFGRDNTRKVSSEHRGILYGDKLSDAIDKKDCRKEYSKAHFTVFKFNDDIHDAGTETASTLDCKFSSRTDTRSFQYNKDKKYHCSDWKADVQFQNVIILMADTKYITTPYKSSTTTYLNYTLTSGKGYYASNGKVLPIKWDATSGRLKLTDESGKKIALNKGNSYIGLASSNNGGVVKYQ